jgi:hypothetical protein
MYATDLASTPEKRNSGAFDALMRAKDDICTLGYNAFGYFDGGDRRYHKSVIIREMINNLDTLALFFQGESMTNIRRQLTEFLTQAEENK